MKFTPEGVKWNPIERTLGVFSWVVPLLVSPFLAAYYVSGPWLVYAFFLYEGFCATGWYIHSYKEEEALFGNMSVIGIVWFFLYTIGEVINAPV